MERPQDITGIWDSGPGTGDRYTFVLNDEWAASPGYAACLGINANPEHPQHGISQFCGCLAGPHLGREITWDSLPSDLQEHVAGRLTQD